MNRRVFSIMAAVVLMTVTGAASVYAQERGVKANIPFTFAAGDSMLPAGDYSLAPLSQNTWVIRNDEGRPAVAALARPNGTNEERNSAKLVFVRCGDRYILSEVRCIGQTTSIPASKAERALEREMARNGSKPETLYVLASVR